MRPPRDRRRALAVYRALLRLYPTTTRIRFGAAQLELFERLWHEAAAGGFVRRSVFWGRTLVDVAANALRAHLSRRGRERRLPSKEMFMQDLKLALRLVRRAPGVTAVVCLTLGVGIGANAAIVSVVDAVLFRPLPYADPGGLVRIWSADRSSGDRFLEASYQDYEAFRDQTDALTRVVAFSRVSGPLTGPASRPLDVVVARITPGWFETFGIQPLLGRVFAAEEYASESRPVMLSHDLWVRRYGGSGEIVGERLLIGGDSFRIVGVMPASFTYPHDADLWRPFTNEERHDEDRELYVIGRLASGDTAASATRQVEAVAERLAVAYPEEDEHLTAWAEPMRTMLIRDVRTQLWLLLGAVSAVLLIVCATIANLLLVRGLSRTREFALRVALGAGRGRLIRQLVTEHSLLVIGGGSLGLLVGWVLLPVLVGQAPPDIPRLEEVAFDGRVVAIMLAVTLLTGLVFGLLPALRSVTRLTRAGRAGSVASSWRNGQRLPRGLVVGEVALSTALVILAGVLSASLVRGLTFDRGFDPRGLAAVAVEMPDHDASAEAIRLFYEDLADDLAQLPGVGGVAFSSQDPLSTVGLRPPLIVDGVPAPSQRYRAIVHVVSPNYFSVTGMSLRQGRMWTMEDIGPEGPEVVVNERFVRSFLRDREPIGARLEMVGGAFVVSGVVSDLQPDPADAPPAIVYVSHRAVALPAMTLLVRTSTGPGDVFPAIRDRIWRHAPDAPIDDLAPLDSRIGEAFAAPRFGATLVGGFAVLALALAAIGIYGVLSFAVARRAREIGVRRAMGATGQSIVGLIVRDGLALALVGIAAGGAIAALVTRGIAHTLVAQAGWDPLSLGAGIGLMALVSLAACWVPARTAARLDPVQILRGE